MDPRVHVEEDEAAFRIAFDRALSVVECAVSVRIDEDRHLFEGSLGQVPDPIAVDVVDHSAGERRGSGRERIGPRVVDYVLAGDVVTRRKSEHWSGRCERRVVEADLP
jgi:hypothetical protein